MARGERVLNTETPAHPPRDRRRVAWLVAKIAIGVGLIAFLFGSGRIELSRLLDIQRPLDFVLAQVMWYCAFHLTVLRWRIILGALDVPARYRDAARLCWLGLLFSQVIPGATGGDVVKGIQIARENPERRPQAVLSVVLDRAIGLTALMLIGVLGVIFCPPQMREDPVLRQLGFLLVGMITIVLGGGALLCWRGFWQQPWLVRALGWLPFRSKIVKIGEALWALGGRRRLLGLALVLSVIAHGLFVLTAFFIARGLTGELPSLIKYYFLVPIGQLAFSLPVTPGGLGVGQWAYEELFRRVGEGHGAELGVFLQLTSVLWALIGVTALVRGGRKVAEEWSHVVADEVVGAQPTPPAAEPTGTGVEAWSGTRRSGTPEA